MIVFNLLDDVHNLYKQIESFVSRIESIYYTHHPSPAAVADSSSFLEAFQLDRDNSSVTRSKAYLETLLDQAGCWIKIHEEKQKGFPTEIFPVWMMAYKVKE